MKRTSLAAIAAILTTGSACADKPVYSEPEQALEHPHFPIVGEYRGQTSDERLWGLQVSVADGGWFGLLYAGGLPGDGWDGEGVFDVAGKLDGDEVELSGEKTPVLRHGENGFMVLDVGGEPLGELEKIERRSPTLGAEPPEDAVILFDGSDLDGWRKQNGMTEGGLLKEGATSAGDFGDMMLHVEFRTPFMPEHGGQGRGNSGCYIMNRYEVQILDSFALKPAPSNCGSLYRTRPADVMMSFPPLAWQTYDIDFTAPRFDGDGNKTANARITVRHNGVVIHDDVELESGTGVGGTRKEVEKASLLLQDHGDPVRFRNIWLTQP